MLLLMKRFDSSPEYEINVTLVWSHWLPDSLTLLLAVARRAVTKNIPVCRETPWKWMQLDNVTNRGQCSTINFELCLNIQYSEIL